MLLLLPTTSVLKRREVPPTASSFSVSATAIITFLCVYSIVVAAVEKGYAFIFFVEVLLLTTSVLKQREVPATVSSFYVSVLDTAMLRTSIAAVVLGCFYFCPLDGDASVMVVDCAAVATGCMLEKYIPAKGCNKIRPHFYFLVEVLLLLLLRAAAAAHNISTQAERGITFSFWWLRCCCSSLIERDVMKRI